MSQDPKTNPPPNGQPKENLEDLVYRSSLSTGNRAVHGANPLVSVPLTILSYAAFGCMGYILATHTDAGKKALKGTMGIDLTEQTDTAPPPPPPPPPAPAAPSAPAPRIQRDAPPPPPPAANSDTVPEIAPRELPREDQTMRYASSASSSSSGPGVGVAGSTGPSTGMAVAGAGQSTHVVDFDFSQMRIKFQPPPPPYPPLAKIARIQGTVVVEITVGPDGIPVAAKAVEGPAQLRKAAEDFAMGWKFEPAMVNGLAQTARFKLTMPFRLKS